MKAKTGLLLRSCTASVPDMEDLPAVMEPRDAIQQTMGNTMERVKGTSTLEAAKNMPPLVTKEGKSVGKEPSPSAAFLTSKLVTLIHATAKG